MRLTPPSARLPLAALAVTAAVAGTIGVGIGAVATRFTAASRPASASSPARAGLPAAAGGKHAPVASPPTNRTSRSTRPPTPPPPKDAWVRVSVATVWVGPHKPRQIDRPALSAHPDIHAWLRRQTVAQRLALVSRVMTQALLGEHVLVLRQRPSWDLVQVLDQRGSGFPQGIVGWVPRRQLTLQPPAAAPRVATVTSPRVHLDVVDARGQVPASYGTRLPVLDRTAHRVRVSIPGVGPAVVPARSVTVRPHVSGAAVVAAARRFLGVPYLWGGMSNWGIDCSGLTYLAYREMGITLPRDAADQSQHGHYVKRRNLRPGDLVFFGSGAWGSIHHVGIYAGHGLLLHAPHTGSHVTYTRLSTFGDYWGARRYL